MWSSTEEHNEADSQFRSKRALVITRSHATSVDSYTCSSSSGADSNSNSNSSSDDSISSTDVDPSLPPLRYVWGQVYPNTIRATSSRIVKIRAGSLSKKIGLENSKGYKYLTIRLVCILMVLVFVAVSTELNRSWDPRVFFYGGKLSSADHFASEMFSSSSDDAFNAGFEPVVNMFTHYDRYVPLPSLNLIDYEEHSVYPVFPEFPSGISRQDMPQLQFNRSGSVWNRFKSAIKENGGRVEIEKDVDLRQVMPMQSELSGYIVYNLLFGKDGKRIRANLDKDLSWFSSHIVLIRTPGLIHSVDGSIIQKGSLIILDGHHTTAVAKICARSPHTLLRLGNYNDNLLKQSPCGYNFSPKQDILVIDGLYPLDVRKLALESGASRGHSMTFHAHP